MRSRCHDRYRERSECHDSFGSGHKFKYKNFREPVPNGCYSVGVSRVTELVLPSSSEWRHCRMSTSGQFSVKIP